MCVVLGLSFLLWDVASNLLSFIIIYCLYKKVREKKIKERERRGREKEYKTEE